MKKFFLLTFLVCYAQLAHADRLFAIPENGKWGFINKSGNIKIRPQFDEVGVRSEKIWPVRVGKKWGFVSEETENVSVAPRYDKVAFFNEGLCFAQSGPKWGVVGKNGVWQIGPRYTFENYLTIQPHFSEGVAAVSISQTEVNKNNYDAEWGFIDRRGRWLQKPQFARAEPFSEGMAEVIRYVNFEPQSGWVKNENGKFTFVAAPKSEGMAFYEPFLDGLAAVETSINRKRAVGFVDKSGKWAIEPKFMAILGYNFQDLSLGFRDGLALVVKGTTKEDVGIGWIDKSGKWAIEPKFKGGGAAFADGLAPVAILENEKQIGGFIDKAGNWVIEPQFEKMGVFSDGLAPVQRPNKKWEFVDKAGKTVIEPRFDYISLGEKGVPSDMFALFFFDGLAFVKEEGRFGYINKSGQYVWRAASAPAKRSSSAP
jgi:hypothetical protein